MLIALDAPAAARPERWMIAARQSRPPAPIAASAAACWPRPRRGRRGRPSRGDPDASGQFRPALLEGLGARPRRIGLEGRLLHPDDRRRSARAGTRRSTSSRAAFAATIAEHGPDCGRLLRLRPAADRGLLRRQQADEGLHRHGQHRHQFAALHGLLASPATSAPSAPTPCPGCYEDLELADLVVLVGSNAAWCHPVLYQRIAARARPSARHAASSSSIRAAPRRATIADLHLPLAPGQRRRAVQRPAGASRARNGAIDRDAIVDAPHRAASRRRCAQRRAARRSAQIARRLRPRRRRRSRRSSTGSPRPSRSSPSIQPGRQPVVARHRQGQRHHQLPSGDRPHRQARHGPVLGHRPAQRHGRPRGRRARQHARRPHGARERRAPRHRAALLAVRRSIADEAGPQGRRHVRRGRRRPHQGALDHGDQSGRQSMPDADARASRARRPARSSSSPMSCRHTDTTRLAACAAAGRGLGREGRHRHQFRAAHLAPARASCRRPARRGPTGGSSARSRSAWASAGLRLSTSPPRSSASTRRCRASRTTARAISTSAPWRRSTTRDYDALAPVPMAGPAGRDRRRRASSPTAASSPPTAGRASSRCAARSPMPTRPAGFPLVLNTGRVRDQWHTMTRTGKSRAPVAALRRALRRDPSATTRARHGIGDGGPRARLDRRRRACSCARSSHRAQRRGCVFVPMHWTERICRRARASMRWSLPSPIRSPASRSSKHTPVAHRAFRRRHAYGVRGAPPQAGERPEADYWAVAKCVGTAGGWSWRWRRTAAELAAIGRAQLASARRLRMDRLSRHRRPAAIASPLRRRPAARRVFIAPDRRLVSRVVAVAQLGARGATRRARGCRCSPAAAGNGADRSGAIVCSCFGVGVNEIAAAAARGCRPSRRSESALQAGTNCGSCRAEIRNVIDVQRSTEPVLAEKRARFASI